VTGVQTCALPIFLQDELEELRLSGTELARIIAVPPNRVSQIIAGKRSITLRFEADLVNIQ